MSWYEKSYLSNSETDNLKYACEKAVACRNKLGDDITNCENLRLPISKIKFGNMVKEQLRDVALKKELHDRFIINNDIEYFQIEDVIADARTVLDTSKTFQFQSGKKKSRDSENENGNENENENERKSSQTGNSPRRLSPENLKEKEKLFQNTCKQSHLLRNCNDMSDANSFSIYDTENIRNNTDVILKNCKKSNKDDYKLKSVSSFSSTLSLVSLQSSTANSVTSRTSSPLRTSSPSLPLSLPLSLPHSLPHSLSQLSFLSSPTTSQRIVTGSGTGTGTGTDTYENPLTLIDLSSHLQKKNIPSIYKEHSSPNPRDSSSTSRESSSSLPSPRPCTTIAFEEPTFSDLRNLKEAAPLRDVEVST